MTHKNTRPSHSGSAGAVKVNSWPPRAWKSLATRADHRYFCATPSSIIAIHLRIRSPPCCPQHPSSTALTCLTSHRPTVRSPIALSSYPPTPTHDSSAPRRGVEGGAGQLVSGGDQGRGSGVVTAAVMGGQAPRPCHPGEIWPPQRVVAGRERCPDTGHAGRRPVRVLCPPCGRPSNRSSGRPVSTRPVSTRPVPSRCPDGWASGVCGSAAALSAPRWPWNGSVRRAVPLGAMASTCRRGPRAAWSSARMGLKGRDGAAVAVGGSQEVDDRPEPAASHAHRLPPGRQGSWPSARVPVGWLGSTRRAGAHQSPHRCVLGRLPAWCPTRGLHREVVTTLRGRWSGDDPASSVPEDPSGSAGEQTAAAARPGHVRSAVRRAPTGPWPAITVVGATGFELVTSSVSVNAGLPLCRPPFSQLAFDRRWQVKTSFRSFWVIGADAGCQPALPACHREPSAKQWAGC